MPTPNVTDKDNLLLQCSCGGKHYLEVSYFADDETEPYVIALIDKPTSLWQLLSGWWKHRRCYYHDVVLRKEELNVLINHLVSLRSKTKPDESVGMSQSDYEHDEVHGKNRLKIAFDVDGTLFDYQGNPRKEVIAMLRLLAAHHYIIVWSGGGKDYAVQRVRELGLTDAIKEVRSKTERGDIDLCFDDEEVNLATLNVRI